jgi:hypothetical protein
MLKASNAFPFLIDRAAEDEPIADNELAGVAPRVASA